MPLIDQMETDLREVFFNLGDFAEQFTYTTTGGLVYPISAIFDDAFRSVDANSGAIVSSQQPKIRVSMSALRTVPAQGDRLRRNKTGIEYLLRDKEPTGNGCVDFLLTEADIA